MFFKVGEVIKCRSNFSYGDASIKRGEQYTVSEMDYNGWISLDAKCLIRYHLLSGMNISMRLGFK